MIEFTYKELEMLYCFMMDAVRHYHGTHRPLKANGRFCGQFNDYARHHNIIFEKIEKEIRAIESGKYDQDKSC